VWRSLFALLATVLVSAGAASPPADLPARLAIDAHTGSVTSVLVPSQATLDCDGGARATGYLSKVAKPACALAGKGTVTAIATEHRGTRLCHEGYGGPQRATITGKIGGHRISVTIDRADGCGIEDWNRLRPLLGAPERRGAIPRRKASASAPTTTTTAAPATYLVQRGDTLTNIAKQFHTSVGAIVATNRLENPDALTEGQQLTMPPSSAVRIDAELVDGGGDTAIGLTLVGAEPSELVTFVVTLPDGSTYTGSPHSTSIYGVVTTTYRATLATGSYSVTATGERGTTAETTFHLVPPD